MKNNGQFQKGHKGYWLGKKQPADMVEKRAEGIRKGYREGNRISYFKGREPHNKGKKAPDWLREKLSVAHLGKVPCNKLNRTPDEIRALRREYRKNNKLQFKAYDHRKREMRKSLKVDTIQMVYEDNIKQYGTLTCYLCGIKIPFGKDHLEHKIPLCRGGSNEYENLAVACQHCNNKKHTKTTEEYLTMVGV